MWPPLFRKNPQRIRKRFPISLPSSGLAICHPDRIKKITDQFRPAISQGSCRMTLHELGWLVQSTTLDRSIVDRPSKEHFVAISVENMAGAIEWNQFAKFGSFISNLSWTTQGTSPRLGQCPTIPERGNVGHMEDKFCLHPTARRIRSRDIEFVLTHKNAKGCINIASSPEDRHSSRR
jgi:hypothetical protein